MLLCSGLIRNWFPDDNAVYLNTVFPKRTNILHHDLHKLEQWKEQ